MFGTILSQAMMAKMLKMALMAVNGIIWPQIWPLLVSMERAGKMQITHENGIEKTAPVQKLLPNQNKH